MVPRHHTLPEAQTKGDLMAALITSILVFLFFILIYKMVNR